MNSLRTFLCVLTAVVVGAFALPANAATKSITLTNVTGQSAVLGATLTAGANQTIYLSLNNTGNSNASSLEIDWTNTPLFTVNSGTINGSKGTITGALVSPGQTPGGYNGIQFTFTLPQKTSVVIALNVTVNAGSTCGVPQIIWQPYAWTGGVGIPSTSFAAPPTGTYTSNLPGAPNCTLSFATQPADAFVSSVITTVPFNSFGAPVKVQATKDSIGQAGVSVSIGSTGGGTCSISGSATTDSSGTATLTSISSSASGTNCQLTATATGFTAATSNAFEVRQPLSTLDCSPANGSTFGDLASFLTSNTVPPTGSADWGLLRGKNTDGNCPFKVPFTFTLDGTNNSALFTEDSLGQSTSVEYIIQWAPVDVDGDGWSGIQPCVAWGMENPQWSAPAAGALCGGDYVPALACIKDDVNAPGDGTGEVMPDIPDVQPFSNFTSTDHPQYQPTSRTGVKAKVCVAQQGWTSNNLVKNGQIQYWHKFIDQSDTGVRLP